MANGTPERPASGDSEDYVLRSGVRSGLKREFAFALKAQSEMSTMGRTRSGKIHGPALSSDRSLKRPKISDGADEPPNTSAPPGEVPSLATPIQVPSLATPIQPGPAVDSQILIGVQDEAKPISTPEATPLPIPMQEGSAAETPIVIDDPKAEVTPVVIDESKEEDVVVIEKLNRRFTRSLLKVTAEEPSPLVEIDGSKETNRDEPRPGGTPGAPPQIRIGAGSAVDSAILISNQGGPTAKDGVVPETAARRFTRSVLKVANEEAPLAAEVSSTMSGGSDGSEEMKGGIADVENGSIGPLRTTPKKKMELKMSKKIALTKFPSNIRELLATGLLEGLPVKYTFRSNKKGGLRGVIKDGSILCFCTLCNGSKSVSAYHFELHAGSSKKHPSDFIYLENGKTIRDVLRACTSAPLDMLESTIQNAISSAEVKKTSDCLKCKDSSSNGKLASICDSCLEAKQSPTSPSPSCRTISSSRLPKPVSVPDSSDSTSKSMSSQKKHGKMTTKDLRLHKLVFMNDTLPDGTEVAYYRRGQRLLEGYIKGSGIFCRCCNTVVSPSLFEAHAGWASHRKPYLNIYTSNGVSLHELSVSLSKGRKFSSSENDDLCRICADGGDLLLCDICPRAFHKECVGLTSIPKGDWYCPCCQSMHQREKFVEHNENAIAAGRVSGVDPIEQIIKRCIRIVKTPESDIGGCVLCRCHDFSKSKFGPRTVLLCDQCEKEFHVGCLKDHNMADLKELPKEKWFCCSDCSRIHAALQKLLLSGSEPLPDLHSDIIKRKHDEKDPSKDADLDVRWRLLSGKVASPDSRLLLSKAVSIFQESFDPIIDLASGRDLIPSMVYGRDMRDQEFGGMYCAVLTVNASVVSAGILRVLGCEVAELPLVATSREKQGQGYFQSLFSCIESLLGSLKVKHLVLPAADEAESIWTKKFGFSKITLDELHEHSKGSHIMTFQGTSMLHKLVPNCQIAGEGQTE